MMGQLAMTPAEIGAWVTGIGGICTGLGTLIGVFLKTRADAYRQQRQADADAWKIQHDAKAGDCLADDDRADRAYKVIFAEMRKQIARLEDNEAIHRKEHQECLKMNAQLQERVDSQGRRITYLEQKLNNQTG
jgi:hypothetical protein